jgi:hypothetical protein
MADLPWAAADPSDDVSAPSLAGLLGSGWPQVRGDGMGGERRGRATHSLTGRR